MNQKTIIKAPLYINYGDVHYIFNTSNIFLKENK